MASRELRNNNYLNLKNGGYPWMDANGKDRELIHRVMRSLPILSMECALNSTAAHLFLHLQPTDSCGKSGVLAPADDTLVPCRMHVTT